MADAAPSDLAWDDHGPRRVRGIHEQRWFRVRTRHFTVYAHRSALPVGRRVAARADAVYDRVTAAFGWTLRGRTVIVVDDSTDGANGLATVAPWRTIRVNGAPPDFDEALGTFDDWIDVLLTHEIAHIVQIGRDGGLPRLLNRALGMEFYPNQALPPWLLEGVATVIESDGDGVGRLQSALFRAWLVASALDGAFVRMGQLSGAPLDWPHGSAWYLYGAWFVRYIADAHGWGAWAEFSDRHGRRVVPLFANRLARRVFGEGFVAAWRRFAAATQGEAAAERVAAIAGGASPPTRLTTAAFRTRTVATTPSGAIAWIEDDGMNRPVLVVGASRFPADDFGDLAFVRQDTVVVSKVTPHHRGVAVNDLYLVDLATGASERLTRAARASQPDVSPDGARVAHVRISHGGADLWVLEIASGDARRVVDAAPGQTADPTWIDDRRIAYVHHRVGGGRAIHVVDTETGVIAPLLELGGTPMDLALAGDRLLFSSDHDGGLDAYAFDIAGRTLCRLTRTPTAALSPVYAADGRVVYATLTGAGYSVVRAAPIDGPCVVVAPPSGAARIEATAATSGAGGPFRPVSSIGSLRVPDGRPQLAISSVAALLGAHVHTSDPAERLLLAANARVDVPALDVFAAGQLSWRQLPVGLSAFAGRGTVRRAESRFVESRYVPFQEVYTALTVVADVSFPRVSDTSWLFVSWTTNRGRPASQFPDPAHDPADLPPREPEFRRFDELRVSAAWRDTDRFADSFTTARGSAADISVSARSPALGASVESADWVATARHYAPLARRPVLALRAAGGMSTSRGVGRRAFSLGGLAPHDPLRSLMSHLPAGDGDIRGFPPVIRIGDRFLRLNTELRMPVVDVDRGARTLPLYVGRVWAAAFADVGWATSGRVRLGDGLLGLGAELRVATTLGYGEGAAFRLGFARGVGADGIWDGYLLYGFEF